MRWALKDLKPVSPSVTYKAERKRIRKNWNITQAAKKCGVSRNAWYCAMAGRKTCPATRAKFAKFVERYA